MCGRFALGVPRQRLFQAVREEHPHLDLDQWVDEDAFQPRFNVAPRSRSPVIRRHNTSDDGPATDSEDNQDQEDASQPANPRSPSRRAVMHTMKWGLIPHWSKHEDTNLNTINAKGENLVEGGGMWNSIKGKKRCAVVCQGYYEWLKKGKDRLPHFTKHKDGKLMFLAGLYDKVTLEGSIEPLWTFTIVTTDANKQLSWLHDRMPVVLSTQAQLDAWLDTSSQTWSERAARVIRPHSSNATRSLECYAVPTDVGKVGAESATFIEPVAKRRDGIQAMFAKQSKTAASLKVAETEAPAGESSGSAKDFGVGSSGKRRRESPQPTGQREPSIEVLDSPPPAAKKIHVAREENDRVVAQSEKSKSSLPGSPVTASKTTNKIAQLSPVCSLP
ncbi:hypothetical protein EW145_g8018 [Phellinidium pouzarii]|uniref:DUF159-domain-containing protein n=1 Tax=Phellinidium pouzarii TaxID=167371 RepID=A0A4S4KBX9_9AGAM|nr:hypothetical protein EW145_g8018 [Phellinidium pouzarii]